MEAKHYSNNPMGREHELCSSDINPMPAPSSLTLGRARSLKGNINLPGDRFVCCHAAFLAALAKGQSKLLNPCDSPWFDHLLDIIRQTGATADKGDNELVIQGINGSLSICEDTFKPHHELILMIISGIIAGAGVGNLVEVNTRTIPATSIQTFLKIFKTDTLTLEGEHESIIYRVNGINTTFRKIQPAQEYLIKTAVFYYHLASGTSAELSYRFPGPSHLENLLPLFGGQAVTHKNPLENLTELERRIFKRSKNSNKQPQKFSLSFTEGLYGASINIPGDNTLGSVFALLAALIPGSKLNLENILWNHSRNGFFINLRKMGAKIEPQSKKEISGEVQASIEIRHADLKGRKFNWKDYYGMTEEIPLLIAAGTFAEGESVFRDITFLRHYKEDHLKAIIHTLRDISAEVGEIDDGLVIRGHSDYDGRNFTLSSHPLIALLHIAIALNSHGSSTIPDLSCLEFVFPGIGGRIRQLANP